MFDKCGVQVPKLLHESLGSVFLLLRFNGIPMLSYDIYTSSLNYTIKSQSIKYI